AKSPVTSFVDIGESRRVPRESVPRVTVRAQTAWQGETDGGEEECEGRDTEQGRVRAQVSRRIGSGGRRAREEGRDLDPSPVCLQRARVRPSRQEEGQSEEGSSEEARGGQGRGSSEAGRDEEEGSGDEGVCSCRKARGAGRLRTLDE